MVNQNFLQSMEEEEYQAPQYGNRNAGGKLQQKAKRQTAAYKSYQKNRRRMAAKSRKANR
jgi:hypothetical protein